MLKRIIVIILMTGMASILDSQEPSREYYPETDPLVQEKLERWQDLKFGLLMHWGPYSQWGIVESWSLCSEDVGWTRRTMGRYEDYGQYRIDYENLKSTFNPTEFDPRRWAEAARAAGMKYVVFTTKHHDGFCMFDTKTTDYRITDEGCRFSADPRSNVTKEIFDAFRKEGLWTGAYFSKPDWHSEYYLWPYFATPDRNVNYAVERYPERWQKFVEFTHNQILELMSDYGTVDILWLDGGWVNAGNRNQDIRMAELVTEARKKQPGLIVVDRAVPGPFQNYLTPENRIPERMLPYPWESCIIMGGGWSYSFDPQFKSSRELVHMLVDIVSKGGNLLLNIGPSPKGTWHDEAYVRLEEMGRWLDVNGEAIYHSRPVAPYKEGKVCLTRQEDGTVYATYLGDENEHSPPSRIWLSSIAPVRGAQISMLGVEGTLEWQPVGNGFLVEVPGSMQENPPCDYAWTLRISGIAGVKER